MYEKLKKIDKKGIFKYLTPQLKFNVDMLSLPKDYLEFIRKVGVGRVDDDEPIELLTFIFPMLNAAKEYYLDDDIYENGAKGEVMIFALDSLGHAYGFDIGDNMSLVYIDSYRIVKKLSLNFKQFIYGLLVCYPQIPFAFSNGVWFDISNEAYQLENFDCNEF